MPIAAIVINDDSPPSPHALTLDILTCIAGTL